MSEPAWNTPCSLGEESGLYGTGRQWTPSEGNSLEAEDQSEGAELRAEGRQVGNKFKEYL